MEFYEDPRFLTAIGIGISFLILSIAYKNYSHGKTRFFRTDYTDEVKTILLAIHHNYDSFGSFTNFLSSNPDLAKKILQHIYTSDSSSFKNLKESIKIQNTHQAKNHAERDEKFIAFTQTMSRIYFDLEYQTKPEFGVCENCFQFLNKSQKKKYKHFKDQKDEFWDWTKWKI